MALQAMNASPYHPKVKTSIRLGDALYVAGGVVAGKMQMECKADKGLGIGAIIVELYAIEELTSRDHSATSTFLQSKRIFQGPALPPSNAVHPHPVAGEPPLPPEYYNARRGNTTFLFRFDLPPSSPSAISFGSGLANVKYEVRASVAVSWKGERRLVTDKKSLDVVEMFEPDFHRSDPEGVIVGEGGKMWVQGRLVGGILVAGQPACIELQVKNHSPKKNSGLSITFTRELHLPRFPMTEKAPLRISDTLTSVSFRGADYIIQPGTEGVANLVFDVPPHARGVKGGLRYSNEEDERVTECLFEVRCIVGVKLAMGFGSKDIQLDIPVTVLHPKALPEPLSAPYPPLSPTPQIPPASNPYSLPISPPPLFSPHHYPSPLPPMSPFNQYVEQGQPGWLPQPTQSPMLYHPTLSPPPADTSVYHNVHYQPLFPPPPLPHAYPMRPSSAEPTPSQALYSVPSGLPIPHMQQPLLPLTRTDIAPSTDREEGKGERSSRITHHLRMSTRHRSVSPQAHRYPIPPVVESHVTGHPGHPVSPPSKEKPRSPLPPAQSLPSPPLQLTIPTGLSMPSEVVSPKPLPSPKQLYTVDPFTHATLAKSERVETLERIAADAERKFTDMSSSVPEIMSLGLIDKEKTLPAPPVPSEKRQDPSGLSDSRPQAQSLFPPESSAGTTPPTPTIAAVTSLKVPRVSGPLSGLDALEARLLAEVGTRKIEQDDRRPDVRSVLPIAIPRPAQEDPANDSAISSLNLPGLGADEMTKMGKASSAHSGGTYRDGERGRSREKMKEPSDGTITQEKRDKKEKKKKERQGEKKDEEVYRLRKAAQGRIAAWLDTIDPDAPSSPVATHNPSPGRKNGDDRQSDTEKDDGDPSPLSTAPPARGDRPDEDGIIALPNPRSSGFMPMSTLRANRQETTAPRPNSTDVVVKLPSNLQKFLPVYPPRPLDPEVRYDVRSARGGRGGKVTAVAAIWASATQPENKPSTPRPPNVKTKVMKPTPFIATQIPENARETKTTPNPRLPRPSDRHAARTAPTQTINNDGNVAMNAAIKRAKVVKSASVPAIVSSSLATPMLSSTASLARPPALAENRIKSQLPTSTAEIRESPSIVAPKPIPAAKGEMAFGQARLKELIKKYQGQTNA